MATKALTVARLAEDFEALSYDPTGRGRFDRSVPRPDQYTRPFRISAGAEVVVRSREGGMVMFDVVNGSLYRADADAFEAALAR